MLEMNKQHMKVRDINALMVLNGLDVMLTANEKDLGNLADRVGGREALKSAHDAIIDVGMKIIETVPDNQAAQVEYQRRQTIAHVGLKPATGTPVDFWPIAVPDIVTLVDSVIHYTCLACDGSQHKCKIREVMKQLPIEGVDTGAVACWRD